MGASVGSVESTPEVHPVIRRTRKKKHKQRLPKCVMIPLENGF
jgi:hypothetical protein